MINSDGPIDDAVEGANRDQALREIRDLARARNVLLNQHQAWMYLCGSQDPDPVVSVIRDQDQVFGAEASGLIPEGLGDRLQEGGHTLAVM